MRRISIGKRGITIVKSPRWAFRITIPLAEGTDLDQVPKMILDSWQGQVADQADEFCTLFKQVGPKDLSGAFVVDGMQIIFLLRNIRLPNHFVVGGVLDKATRWM